MTFGMNLHLVRPKVTHIVSDVLHGARVVEHGDGRQDVHLKPKGQHYNAHQAEELFQLPLNDIRRMVYEYHRERGESHEQAVRRLGTGKVEV